MWCGRYADHVETVLRDVLFAFVVFQLARAALAVRRRRDLVGRVRGALRWWMWALTPAILAVVAVTAAALVQVPGLDWGWGRFVGVTSNAFLSPVAAAAGSASRGVVRLLETGAALAFIGLLAYVMPLLVLAEERLFRRGLERGGARRWARATVVFGLAHLLMGIPVGLALALSWGGLAFGLVYRHAWRSAPVVAVPSGARGADPDAKADAASVVAAAAHLAYNLTLLALLAVALVVGF